MLNPNQSYEDMEKERGSITNNLSNKFFTGVSENTRWVIVLVIVNIITYLYIQTYLPTTNFLFIFIPSLIILLIITLGKKEQTGFRPDWEYRVIGMKAMRTYISRLNPIGMSKIPSGTLYIDKSGVNNPITPTLKVLGFLSIHQDTNEHIHFWMSLSKDGTIMEIAEGEYKGELYDTIGKGDEQNKNVAK